MQALGLDIDGRSAWGVVLDGSGAVLRSAQCDDPGRLQDVIGELARGFQIGAFGFAAEAVDDRSSTLQSPDGLPKAQRCTPGAAAVIAETWVGAARGARHAVCLLIGERVIAGLMLDGVPVAGAHGLAGSAAWLALNPVERQDYRKFGSLAAEVSNNGIARRLAWRIQAGDSSAVLERAGDMASITAAHVFEGARAGDGVAISVVRDTAKYIGMAAANIAVCIDPEIVVLGGDAAAAGDLMLEPARQECARRLPPGLIGKVSLTISPLANYGVAIGAARLAALSRA